MSHHCNQLLRNKHETHPNIPKGDKAYQEYQTKKLVTSRWLNQPISTNMLVKLDSISPGIGVSKTVIRSDLTPRCGPLFGQKPNRTLWDAPLPRMPVTTRILKLPFSVGDPDLNLHLALESWEGRTTQKYNWYSLTTTGILGGGFRKMHL